MTVGGKISAPRHTGVANTSHRRNTRHTGNHQLGLEGLAVYRVFEALDELGAIVEEARGVPMTAGCMVPRGDVLELIDDIKDAIPGELDDAQDVLDARDAMLRDAKEHSDSMVANATAEADSLINHSRAEADRMLADAKGQADRMVAEARQHSERMVGEARDEAERIAATAKREYDASTGRAKAEADRLIENGNLSYEKAVQEGIKEQQRLVAQTEIVQTATARGHPADRLRPRRGRPAARRMRHLRRQQARRVRGLPERDAALGRPWTPPVAHGGRHARLRPTLTAASTSITAAGQRRAGRRIAAMAERTAHRADPTIALRDRRLPARPATGFDAGHCTRRCRLPRASASSCSGSRRARRSTSTSGSSRCRRACSSPGPCRHPPPGSARAASPPSPETSTIDLTELFAYPDSDTEATTEEDEVGHVVTTTTHRSRTADHRRRRAGAAVLTAVRRRLPRAVPAVRCSPGRRRARSPATTLIDPRWAKLAAMLPTEPDSEEPPETSGGPA